VLLRQLSHLHLLEQVPIPKKTNAFTCVRALEGFMEARGLWGGSVDGLISCFYNPDVLPRKHREDLDRAGVEQVRPHARSLLTYLVPDQRSLQSDGFACVCTCVRACVCAWTDPVLPFTFLSCRLWAQHALSASHVRMGEVWIGCWCADVTTPPVTFPPPVSPQEMAGPKAPPNRYSHR
jgi:hypothetical protein